MIFPRNNKKIAVWKFSRRGAKAQRLLIHWLCALAPLREAFFQTFCTRGFLQKPDWWRSPRRVRNNAKTKKQNVLELVRTQGVLRPGDLDQYKIARVYLSRMCGDGLLKRVARGIYTLPETNLDDGTEIEEVCR